MTAPAAPAAADSEDYSSEEDRQQAQRRRQKQRQKDREAQGKSKGKSRKSDAGAGEGGKLVAPAAGLGGQGEEEWSQWASAELEQQLLDEVHTTGEWVPACFRPPSAALFLLQDEVHTTGEWVPSACCCCHSAAVFLLSSVAPGILPGVKRYQSRKPNYHV